MISCLSFFSLPVSFSNEGALSVTSHSVGFDPGQRASEMELAGEAGCEIEHLSRTYISLGGWSDERLAAKRRFIVPLSPGWSPLHIWRKSAFRSRHVKSAGQHSWRRGHADGSAKGGSHA